ncbi:MAG TPA: glycosyltransferase family 2 protein [Cellvibrionaceae bacterium]
MSRYWLSILIPVYNVESYIEQCLFSFAKQLDRSIEVILLDDCSTDQSIIIAKKIISSHPQIRIIAHDKNAGLSAARNSLLKHAQGDYIWFLDSDDFLMPQAIGRLKTIVNTKNPDLILCDFLMHRDRLRLKHKLRGELHRKSFKGTANTLIHNKNQLICGCYATGRLHIWSKIAKRALWDTIQFPAGRLMEDVATTPYLLMRAESFYYCPEVWVAYRQRPGSILSTPNPLRLRDSSLASDGVLTTWKKRFPQLNRHAEFYFAHFCSKTLVGNIKKLCRSAAADEIRWHQQQYRNNIQRSPVWVIWEYVKRGWFIKAIQLAQSLR